MNISFKDNIITILDMEYGKSVRESSAKEIYFAASKAAMVCLRDHWKPDDDEKSVSYFTLEAIHGFLFHRNLFHMHLLDELNQLLAENNIDGKMMEAMKEEVTMSKGFGNTAFSLFEASAAKGISFHGYGIYYQYGFYQQSLENGIQKEIPDVSHRAEASWFVRREEDKVTVQFKNQKVYAIPYDTPIIGYGMNKINTLRLWQAEPVKEVDMALLSDHKYEKAFHNKLEAETIICIIDPNDSSEEGKQLRLKQEYFLVSASLQDMIRRFKVKYSDKYKYFPVHYAIQLHDTYPIIAIPEFIRLLVEEEGLSFTKAFHIAKQTFSYTNHTDMIESMERCNANLFKSIFPQLYRYINLLNKNLIKELKEYKKTTEEEIKPYLIIENDIIHMVRMALFVCYSIDGITIYSSEKTKQELFPDWAALYPKRFHHIPMGISPRCWLALPNKELAQFITDKIGSEWITNLQSLADLATYAENNEVLKMLGDIKFVKKKQLADYIFAKEGIVVDPEFIYDIQLNKIQEDRRQLLNALSILDIYYGLKDGRIKDFHPTVFIFGGISQPGYIRAKAVIKFIHEIAKMIQRDMRVRDKLQVVFISNYNVLYAEKLIPAADITEQISAIGTELYNSSILKFMLNGAIRLETFEGTNIDLKEKVGDQNNYVFGVRSDEIEKTGKNYNPWELYQHYSRIKKVLDTLVNKSLDDETGMFSDVYNAILDGSSWHWADHYHILSDFLSYCDTKLLINRDYTDRNTFLKKSLLNIANAGNFSSDQTVEEYTDKIWFSK